jgi:hypothetical protein
MTKPKEKPKTKPNPKPKESAKMNATMTLTELLETAGINAEEAAKQITDLNKTFGGTIPEAALDRWAAQYHGNTARLLRAIGRELEKEV